MVEHTFTRLKVSNLRDEEYVTYCHHVLSLVQDYDLVALGLERTYTFFVAQVEALAAVHRREDYTALTAAVAACDVERAKLFRSLMAHAKSLMGLGSVSIITPVMVESAKQVHHFLGLYGHETTRLSYPAETQRLRECAKAFYASASLQEAAGVLDLTQRFAELFATNEQFNQLYYNRIAEKANEPVVDIRALRKSSAHSMRKLFAALEVYAFERDDPAFGALITTLNNLTTRYRILLTRRACSPSIRGDVTQ